jgi:hypothetical protein
LPLLTAYAKERRSDRPLKRLYSRREAMMERLITEYRAALEFRNQRAEDSVAGKSRRLEEGQATKVKGHKSKV